MDPKRARLKIDLAVEEWQVVYVALLNGTEAGGPVASGVAEMFRIAYRRALLGRFSAEEIDAIVDAMSTPEA